MTTKGVAGKRGDKTQARGRGGRDKKYEANVLNFSLISYSEPGCVRKSGGGNGDAKLWAASTKEAFVGGLPSRKETLLEIGQGCGPPSI